MYLNLELSVNGKLKNQMISYYKILGITLFRVHECINIKKIEIPGYNFYKLPMVEQSMILRLNI